MRLAKEKAALLALALATIASTASASRTDVDGAPLRAPYVEPASRDSKPHVRAFDLELEKQLQAPQRFGLEIASGVREGVFRYVRDDSAILQQTDDAGNTITRYEWGGDGLVAMQHVSEGRRFSLFDGLGSVTGWSRADGGIGLRRSFDAWGQVRSETGDTEAPFAFTGYEFDEATGAYYAKARFYDPEIGRFLSADPMEYVDGPNVYAYARNNPLAFTDPLGLATTLVTVTADGKEIPDQEIEGDELQRLLLAEGRLKAGAASSLVIQLGMGEDIGADKTAALTPNILSAGTVIEDATKVGVVVWGAPALAAAATALPGVIASAKGACLVSPMMCYEVAAGGLGAVMGMEGPDPVPVVSPARVATNAVEVAAEALPSGMFGTLSRDLRGTGLQANHLNQYAAFRSVIPRSEGVAAGMRGNAFTDVGSPHFRFHESLESFWDPFRRGGSRFGEYPTNSDYDAALRSALLAGNVSAAEASALANQARAQRLEYGLLDADDVLEIPGRMNLSGR